MTARLIGEVPVIGGVMAPAGKKEPTPISPTPISPTPISPLRKIPSCLPFLQGLALALLVLSLASAQTTGASISIDDVAVIDGTDVLTISQNGLSNFTFATGVVTLPAGGGLVESLTFSGDFTSSTSLASTVVTGVNFLSPAGEFEPAGSVSDTLSITFTPTTAPTSIFVQGQFLSDGSGQPPALPSPALSITENGNFQDVSSLLAQQGAPGDFIGSARSDIGGPEPTPEPSSWVLLAIGVLMVTARLRKRSAA
jgi:hypothetical protein